MSSEIWGHSVTFTCDVCGDVEINTGPFTDVWEDLKTGGWEGLRNEYGEWEHRCPDCVGS